MKKILLLSIAFFFSFILGYGQVANYSFSQASGSYAASTGMQNNNYDIVYWGSPVKDQPLGSIWMASNWVDTFYNF